MSLPLVTVGVALYNHQEFIQQCLESVLLQSYENIELIVIDDGSSDESAQRAEQCLNTQKLRSNVHFSSRPNRGMCNTLNEIAEQAKGQYISFIGSDDHWFPDKITDQLAYLQAHPEHVLVHSNAIKVDAQDRQIKPIDYSTKVNSGSVYQALITRQGGINTPSHLFRSSVFESVGYYDPQFRFEDTDFWLRLSKHHQIGFINKCHTYYRWHGDNLSRSDVDPVSYYDELIRIYEKNIDEPDLLRRAVGRMYKKCAEKSLKAGRFATAFRYALKGLGCWLGKTP